jgi:WD40 repeat protein
MDDGAPVTTLTSPLEEIRAFGGHSGPVQSLSWAPQGWKGVVTVDQHTVRQWCMDEAGKDAIIFPQNEDQKLGSMSWDPHHETMVAVACDSHVRGIDFRSPAGRCVAAL